MRLLRRTIVVAATAALGGCVLLVDSFDTSEHCGIQGTGECAQCIKTRCQVPIDRCCNDRECLGGRMLGAMDACGHSHGEKQANCQQQPAHCEHDGKRPPQRRRHSI